MTPFSSIPDHAEANWPWARIDEGRVKKETNSKKFVKTMLCSNNSEAQCRGGFGQ